MANSKPTPKKLNCKITDIKPDPLHKKRMLVAVEFDDGNKKLKPWHQAFSVLPEEVISVDDFLNLLLTMHIGRPEDPYTKLKRAMDVGETFVLNLTAKIEPGAQN